MTRSSGNCPSFRTRFDPLYVQKLDDGETEPLDRFFLKLLGYRGPFVDWSQYPNHEEGYLASRQALAGADCVAKVRELSALARLSQKRLRVGVGPGEQTGFINARARIHRVSVLRATRVAVLVVPPQRANE